MEPWIQIYDPLGHIVLSALVAAIPLFLLFYLLAVKKLPGQKAALLCTGSALVLAVLVWRLSAGLAASAGLMGFCFGLFPIIWIVVNAVWIYNMTVESGEFEIIRRSLASLTDDRRLQAIFIAYAFNAFLEGASGFGTPVAITAAMLVGLGFKPIYAAGICLIGNSAPAIFGALGIPIFVSADLTGLDLGRLAAMVGFHLAWLSLVLPLWICAIMCGFRKALEIWPALLVGGGSFSLTMYLTAKYAGPALPNVTAGLASLACLGVFLKFWRPKAIWRFPGEEAGPVDAFSGLVYGPGRIIRAWLPYVIVTVAVFAFGHKGFAALAAGASINFEWPWLHNLVIKAAPIAPDGTLYAAVYKFNFLQASGTAIFLAGIISALTMKGYSLKQAAACFVRSCRQLRYSILTVGLVLALAYIMNYSGMSSTLGLAFTGTGVMYPFFAPIIGWVGVFLTGSDTSSNALFSSLQDTTGRALDLDPYLTVGVNSSGGATGKMISPQTISVATAATNQPGKEGELFSFALKHSLVMLFLVCLFTVAQAYLF